MQQVTNEDRKCSNCIYFHARGRECRRYPPQIWVSTVSADDYCSSIESFPQVSEDTWCGEFEHVLSGKWVVPFDHKLLDKKGNEIGYSGN